MAIRIFDIIFSLLLIIVLLPVMFLLLLLCSIFIEFPPIYISKRIGKGKKAYTHFKYKSMKSGPELGRVFFEQDRINRFGRFIRKYHLDELPELFLILIGKMSFVGPRALPIVLLDGLDYETRCKVLPGNTCLSQIWLLKKGQLDKHLQIKLDNLYVNKRSFQYNLKIILTTVKYLFKSKKIDLNPNLNKQRISFKRVL
ncbi:MAG: sugar transferase [Bacteroidales bacterium]|nr:sugar transferase [Bacteroidales bacterium]